MSGRWWRAYERSRHDPKLLKLSDRDFRGWYLVVCTASAYGGTLPPLADLAIEIRRSEDATSKLLATLNAAALLDENDGRYMPHNWNGLQYKSDVSNERVKRFRQRQCNVTETPSESETDTEADTEKKDHSASKRSAERGTRLAEDFMISAEDRAFAADLGLDPDLTADEFRDFWTAVPGTRGRKLNWSKTFRNRCRELAKRPARTGGYKPAVASTTVDHDSDVQWRARLRTYRPGGFWQEGNWGPPPESGHCRAPKPILDEWRGAQT